MLSLPSGESFASNGVNDRSLPLLQSRAALGHVLVRVGRSACFDGCPLDEAVGPSIAGLIGSLIGRNFSLTLGEARWVAKPLNKRQKTAPHIKNPPNIQTLIRRLVLMLKIWESSIVILKRFIQRCFTSPFHRYTTFFESPSIFRGRIQQCLRQNE